jgi:4-diphosphocytidyl-2-C-methyl-D-erythritol kinase
VAALRLIAQLNGLDLDDPRFAEAARVTGADVPVCLYPQPRMMRGIGDVLSTPLTLPKLGLLLVHPGVAVATKPVFQALNLAPGTRCDVASASLPVAPDRKTLLGWLAGERNDLQPAAISIAPPIADVLEALAALAGCRIARMSGSGSACFAMFDSARAALSAARHLATARPQWWVRGGGFGG